jgi:hypothetical protein
LLLWGWLRIAAAFVVALAAQQGEPLDVHDRL